MTQYDILYLAGIILVLYGLRHAIKFAKTEIKIPVYRPNEHNVLIETGESIKIISNPLEIIIGGAIITVGIIVLAGTFFFT